METVRDLEIVRSVAPGRRALELRTDGDGSGMPELTCRFSPFKKFYEVNSFWEGHFVEQTLRGAFKKTIKENRDNIRTLFDHGYDPSIGNKVLAPIDDLREDPDTAVSVGRLFDTSYNRDLVPGLEAGVYGSSFRFKVIQDSWNDEPGVSDHNPKGLPERTITEVRLFEAGPVTFPASPTATAGVRSDTDVFYERAVRESPDRYSDLLARARTLRHPGERTPAAPVAVEDTADGTGAALHGTTEPTRSHSDGYGPAARRELIYLVTKGTS